MITVYLKFIWDRTVTSDVSGRSHTYFVLQRDFLRKYLFIPLDIFGKSQQNRNIAEKNSEDRNL